MSTLPGEPRTYRTRMARPGLVGFRVQVRETDLWVLAARDFSRRGAGGGGPGAPAVGGLHRRASGVFTALTPWPEDAFAPPVVREMIGAADRAGVGPMAAVAGALAARVGRPSGPLSAEVIVENGGDIYLKIVQPATVALFAGDSPLSHRVGLKIDPASVPWGCAPPRARWAIP